jgi:predicted amidohydrolase
MIKVAVIQLSSRLDPQENIQKLTGLLQRAKGQGAMAAFLPECFYSISNGKEPSPYLVDESNPDCEHLGAIKKLATDSGLDLIGGSAATLVEGKVINRVYNVSSQGEFWPGYDKMHLFACTLKEKSIDEADIYTPGTHSQLLSYAGFDIGLGVCFDMRYPEMALDYRKSGASILTFSSAFTVPTGKAHWHLLNRARAVENQCYVISAAQCGQNNERISTYGHSLIIDPWGEVLVDLEDEEGIGIAEISFERLDEVRAMVHMGR